MILGCDGMRRGLVLAVVAAVMATGTTTFGQTPAAMCGADSLYLYSPATVNPRLIGGDRPGVMVSWPDLDPLQVTCFALTDSAGLGFTVTATGGFRDRVDRQLVFTAAGSGEVGAAQSSNLVFDWISEGSSTYGRLAGVVNLANNGGFRYWNEASGLWTTVNDGLPFSWRQVNCMALARGADGVLLAGLSRGSPPQGDPTGLWRHAGGAWTRLAPDVFGVGNLITDIAVSPASNDRFAVGTATRGLYVTSDGGATFTQWRSELDPSVPATTNYKISAIEWTSTSLVVAVTGLGVFVSTTEGSSFVATDFRVPIDRDVAGGAQGVPDVRDLVADPADPDRLVAALWQHACYESTDGGFTWIDRYGDLNAGGEAGTWVRNGARVAIVAGSPSTILLGLAQQGLYRTADGGATWTLVAGDLQPAAVQLQDFSIVNVPGRPGAVAVFEDGHGLLRSEDGGATWVMAPVQAALNLGFHLLPGWATGDLLLGSWGGGVYVEDAVLPLNETYTGGTSQELRSLDLGLNVTFSRGPVFRGDMFRIKAQTFQGWAVWRSSEADPDDMTLVGLYDRVNPEDCIVGFCGDRSYQVIPRCFAAKRAACFEFSTPDTVRFFDDEIYNGFGYNYAVTSFDYGNTALTSPADNRATLVFSPRWVGDLGSPFPGSGNRVFLQVNEPPAHPIQGDVIYAFPNPVRRGVGFPGREGERVAITNLPEGASVRIFTVAGDDVRELGPELQSGGQIYWGTDNGDGQPVAPGVYLYKVEMPQREAYWGRIVVIR
ncbi:MAG: hypothetical protein IPK64_08080 [bacterium]|nr:hypothetical protein [bacterium]